MRGSNASVVEAGPTAMMMCSTCGVSTSLPRSSVRRLAGCATPSSPCAPRTCGGGHDSVCKRFQEVRRLGPKSPHRMACPLRRPRDYGVLACGRTLGVYLLPTQGVLVVGSGRDDRGRLTP